MSSLFLLVLLPLFLYTVVGTSKPASSTAAATAHTPSVSSSSSCPPPIRLHKNDPASRMMLVAVLSIPNSPREWVKMGGWVSR